MLLPKVAKLAHLKIKMYLDKIITSPGICTEYFPNKKKKQNATKLYYYNSYQTYFSFSFQVSVGKFSAPAAAPTHRQHSNLRATGRAPKAKNPKFYNTSESESDSDLEPPGHRVSTKLPSLFITTHFFQKGGIDFLASQDQDLPRYPRRQQRRSHLLR
jgi:hypothetical protein